MSSSGQEWTGVEKCWREKDWMGVGWWRSKVAREATREGWRGGWRESKVGVVVVAAVEKVENRLVAEEAEEELSNCGNDNNFKAKQTEARGKKQEASVSVCAISGRAQRAQNAQQTSC